MYEHKWNTDFSEFIIFGQMNGSIIYVVRHFLYAVVSVCGMCSQ